MGRAVFLLSVLMPLVSCTLCHALCGVSTLRRVHHLWRFNLSFEAAHERIRQVRPICNPNTGKHGRTAVWRVALQDFKRGLEVLGMELLEPRSPRFEPLCTEILKTDKA